MAYPDTCVGTDSHTAMVNGLGVVGWGVGGIEAEAATLGQPVSMLIPRVVGFKLTAELPAGTTATDLVLTITEMLRQHGVVGKFVEFYGTGVSAVPVANRATIGNMSPEYGSTIAVFPVDDETLRYLKLTGRDDQQIALVEAYAKEQGLWHDPNAQLRYSEYLELDLATVVPSIAGPKRPQGRVALSDAKAALRAAQVDYVDDSGEAEAGHQPVHGVASTVDASSADSFPASDAPAVTTSGDGDGVPCNSGLASQRPSRPTRVALADGSSFEIDHGAVSIAAITSCTNTSNPSVMIGAALLAKKAVDKGLASKPWVKTTLAPGSKVAMDYYERAGLTPYLEKLGFNLVGYGCTTCIAAQPASSPSVERLTDRQRQVVDPANLGGSNRALPSRDAARQQVERVGLLVAGLDRDRDEAVVIEPLAEGDERIPGVLRGDLVARLYVEDLHLVGCVRVQALGVGRQVCEPAVERRCRGGGICANDDVIVVVSGSRQLSGRHVLQPLVVFVRGDKLASPRGDIPGRDSGSAVPVGVLPVNRPDHREVELACVLGGRLVTFRRAHHLGEVGGVVDDKLRHVWPGVHPGDVRPGVVGGELGPVLLTAETDLLGLRSAREVDRTRRLGEDEAVVGLDERLDLVRRHVDRLVAVVEDRADGVADPTLSELRGCWLHAAALVWRGGVKHRWQPQRYRGGNRRRASADGDSSPPDTGVTGTDDRVEVDVRRRRLVGSFGH